MKCPECSADVPMPDLMCACDEPTCTDCHNRLGHPGTPCPDCPGSRGFFVIGRRPNGQKINAKCEYCDGTGKVQ